MNEIQQEIEQQKVREKQEELEYRKAVLNALQGIEKNTAFLSEVTLLLQKNNEKQDELFQLLVEIMEIMKSKTIEETESKYRKVMRKIGEFTGDIGTIQTLYGIGQAVFNAFQSIQN
jgi:flagellar motor component MotA